MNMYKLRRFFIMMVLLITVLLCACGKEENEIVEITMIHGWGSTREDHVAMRKIYEEFEKEHPEIRLNLVSMPSSTDVLYKTSDLLTIGKIPDIIFTGGEGGNSVYRFMVENGYAVDIMPYMEKDEAFAQDVSPYFIENWMTEDNELYTVSDVLLMGGYWYNEEIFEAAGIDQVPRTWDDWFTMCEKVKAYSLKKNSSLVPYILDIDHFLYLSTAIVANEDVGLLENLYGNINEDLESTYFIDVMEQMKKISNYARVEEDYNYLDTLSCFNNGETAIYINGVWANTMIDSNLKVSYASFPSDDGTGISTKSASVGYILGNTKDERRIEASIEFVKYMLSDSVAVQILELTGQMPSNPAIDVAKSDISERMKQAVDYVESAGRIIKAPENIWNLNTKEKDGKALLMFLKGSISGDELKNIILEK